MDVGFGFFQVRIPLLASRACWSKKSPRSRQSKARRDARGRAGPGCQGNPIQKPGGAIAKIDAGMEAQNFSASGNLQRLLQCEKAARRTSFLKSLFANEREAYAAWSLT